MPDTQTASAFEAAYQAALPGHLEATADHSAKLGLIGAGSLPALGTLQTSFCSEWPEIHQFINYAISVIGLWPSLSARAVQAKAAITAFDSMFVPVVCGAASPMPTPKPVKPTGHQA